MKKTTTNSFLNRIYLLLFVAVVSITQSSCLFSIYSPDSTVSMTGTTSYCQGAAASANTLTYGQCTLGGGLLGNQGVGYTAQWYYNTTGGTVVGTSTPYGAPISGTSPAGGNGTLTYTPSTATAGTFYYFCYVTWGTTGTCTPDYTSNAQTITVSAAPVITGTATVCQGQTTTLATTSTGGAWSSSNTAIGTVNTSGVVTGLAPGTTTVGYTVGGCMGSVVVTVNAGPSAITPATPTTICQGTTISFSSSGSGSWTSSNTGIGTVNSTSGLVGGVGGGTVTITYTNTTTGCYVTKPVTVTPTPTGITGPGQVCIGETIALTPSTPGGTWASSNTAVGTVNASGVVTGLTSGTTNITYTGCGFVTKEITVNPLPDPITGTLTVCETAGTTMLFSTTLGGTWSSSNPNATATTMGPGSGLITGVSDGTATITYTSAVSCIRTAVVTVQPAPDPITGNAPICAGQSLMLFNTIPGGSWVSGNPFVATVTSGGMVTGMSGGSAVITYSNNCGFSTVNVTINPLPQPIEGRDTVCVGGTTAFTDPTIGGTWSSSFPVIASVLTSSGLITGNLVGSSTITYTMPGGCYITRPVHVQPMPPAITGTMQACPGTTTTLFNAITGGLWYSGSPSIATVNSSTGVVTGVAAGNADITYQTAAGCPAYANVLINPLPAPIIGADVIACAADKDTLFNPTPGGTWSSLTPAIATVGPTTGIVTVLTGGMATIRYTLPTGCGINKSISVNPAPAPTVTYNHDANTFYTETTWGSYQWHNTLQGAIPGATSYSTAALYFTQYWVVVSDGNDCFAPSAPFDYNSHTGVNEAALNRDNYFVFPNPSAATVFIEAPVTVKAVITTVDGKVLISQERAKEVDISKLANGMYMIMLYDETGAQRSVHKLVKQ